MAREATLLLLFGGLVTASLLLAGSEAMTPTTRDAATAADRELHHDAAPPAPAVAVVPSAAGAAVPADRSRQLELPDGTFVPALNGAVEPAPLATYWGPFPWSPNGGIESGQGVDWYRHADGSYSTTQMVWRRDLGREVAMTRVAHPGPAPVATEPPHR